MDVEADEVNQRREVFTLEEIVEIRYSYKCWCGHGTSSVFATVADAVSSWRTHCQVKHSYKIQPQ